LRILATQNELGGTFAFGIARTSANEIRILRFVMRRSTHALHQGRPTSARYGTRGDAYRTGCRRIEVHGIAMKKSTNGSDKVKEVVSVDPLHLATASKRQAAQLEQMASAVPFNAGKSRDFGRESAIAPAEGVRVKDVLPIGLASTLTESNVSDKSGNGGLLAGRNALDPNLDAVRSDAAGRSLTTNQGVSVGDNQNSLKAGLRGPSLLEDFILREKITHFDHERIPERVVHARGSAAHGYFQAYGPMGKFTRAAPFQAEGKITPVFARFSTVAGERGSSDTARDIRGFAVKFYTNEGNWDLVGNNIPVFFIQDAIKFPDLIHAVKPEPHNGLPQAASAHDTFWDFVSLMPESTHTLMWVMSDRGIPRSLRMMQGFGVHTYRLVNDKGAAHFVKFHWKPSLGTHSLVWDEAMKLSGADSDFHRRDLWEAIEAGEYPQWELGFQMFTEEQAAGFSFDVLDATKLIPEELVPVTPVGRMVLNRNPDNFFAETEQVAFCTAHVIPGIDFSDDPLLAGRIHSYIDTQISRLGGANFHEIPINRPLATVNNNQRDGLHREAVARGRVAYEPNSLGGGCPFQAGTAGFRSFPQAVEGDKLRGKPEKFADHYTQATLFYESQSIVEKRHIAGGFRFELSKLTVPAIRERMLASLVNVSAELAATVADGLGIVVPRAMPRASANPPPPEVIQSQALSLHALPGDGGIRTRSVAILVAEGTDGAAVAKVQIALRAAGASTRLIAAQLGRINGDREEAIVPGGTFENSSAVLFDGLVLPGGEEGVQRLGKFMETADFILSQYRHCKTILALGSSKSLLARAGIAAMLPNGQLDPGVVVGDDASGDVISKFMVALGKHRHPEREISSARE
jgi:catalase